MSGLQHPAAVQARLEALDAELAVVQNEYEDRAFAWFRAKRDKELEWAKAFIVAEGTVDQRKALATIATGHLGVEEEGGYEGIKARLKALESRATIGQSVLKSQGRAGA